MNLVHKFVAIGVVSIGTTRLAMEIEKDHDGRVEHRESEHHGSSHDDDDHKEGHHDDEHDDDHDDDHKKRLR